MAGTNRIAVGVAIVGVGLCAALPFSRTPPPTEPPAGSVSEPNPRGKDEPETALVFLPVLALDASPGGTNMPLPGGPAPVAQVQASPVEPFPAVPRLLELSTLPGLADTFEEAVAVGSPARQTSPVEHPRAGSPGDIHSSVRLGSPIAVPAATSEIPWREPTEAARQPVPAATALQAEPAHLPPARKHRIRDGDTLRSVARRYLGDEARYLEIFAANRHLLTHPDLLPLGAELAIPGATGAVEAGGAAEAGGFELP